MLQGYLDTFKIVVSVENHILSITTSTTIQEFNANLISIVIQHTHISEKILLTNVVIQKDDIISIIII